LLHQAAVLFGFFLLRHLEMEKKIHLDKPSGALICCVDSLFVFSNTAWEHADGVFAAGVCCSGGASMGSDSMSGLPNADDNQANQKLKLEAA
jgi:hypothetical protein